MGTAGNLVFQGTAFGDSRAYSADNGKQLFSYPVQSGVMAGASSFSVHGVQYVAIITGRGGSFLLAAGYAAGPGRNIPNLPRLLVFKLGGTAKLPALLQQAPTAFNPPPRIGTPTQIAEGRALFSRNCQVCHGGNAAGGGGTPDPTVGDARRRRHLEFGRDRWHIEGQWNGQLLARAEPGAGGSDPILCHRRGKLGERNGFGPDTPRHN